MVLGGFWSPDASGMNYIPIPGPWTFFMTFLKLLKILFFANRKFFLDASSILIRKHSQCVFAGFACHSLLYRTLSQDTYLPYIVYRIVLSAQNRAGVQEKNRFTKNKNFKKIRNAIKKVHGLGIAMKLIPEASRRPKPLKTIGFSWKYINFPWFCLSELPYSKSQQPTCLP